eukprot:jgi/Bigna1/72998/fgenesh1_pg.22_\
MCRRYAALPRLIFVTSSLAVITCCIFVRTLQDKSEEHVRALSYRLGNKDNRSSRSIRAARLKYSECFEHAIVLFRLVRRLTISRHNKASRIFNLPDGIWSRIVAFAFPKGHRDLLKAAIMKWNVDKALAAPIGKFKGFAVMVRKRPVLPFELKAREFDCVSCFGRAACCHDGRVRLEGLQAGSLHMVHRDFFFDGVFNHTHTNDHVFEHTVKHLLSHCLAGKNSTFICHGQTGTGKTYTVTGMQNLVARALFPDEQERKKGEPHQRRIKKICVEFFELFGKECRDLLADRKRVYLRADSDRRVHARGGC